MLVIKGRPSSNYSVQLRSRATNATVGSLLTIPESTVPGFYSLEPVGVAAGEYWAHWYRDQGTAAEKYIGFEEYNRTATAEITLPVLNTAIGTRSSHSAADVWAVTTRALTDKANFALSAATVTSIVTAVWAAATRTITDKTGFALTAGERTSIATSVWGAATRSLTTFGTLAVDVWAVTTRTLTGAVTTDAASRTASQADVSALATTAQLTTAQNAIINRGDTAWTTAVGAATLAQVNAARDFVVARGDDNWLTASGFATPLNVTNAQTAIIDHGDVNWIGNGGSGGAVDLTPVTTALDELETQLIAVGADAAIARKGVTNNKNLNLTNDTGTLYDDDNETPIVVFDLAPSAIDSTSRTRRT